MWRSAALSRRRLADYGALLLVQAAYTALMRVTRQPARRDSLWQLAVAVSDEAGLPPAAAAAAILAMADMGLFELALDARPVSVRRSGRGKADPDQSEVWRAICRWRTDPRP